MKVLRCGLNTRTWTIGVPIHRLTDLYVMNYLHLGPSLFQYWYVFINAHICNNTCKLFS